MLIANGETVATRIKYIVPKKAGVEPKDLVPLAIGTSILLQKAEQHYQGLTPEVQSKISRRVHNQAHLRDLETGGIELPDGGELLVTNPRLGQLYFRENEREYDFVIDVAHEGAFKIDGIMVDETAREVPNQFLPIVFGLNSYRMTNINPFNVTFPDGQKIAAIQLSKDALSIDMLPSAVQVAIHVMAREGLFPVNSVGKPMLQFTNEAK